MQNRPSTPSSLVASLLLLMTAGLAGQDQPMTFRSSVDVVTVHASVRDRQGRPMRGLGPDAFSVLDNGQSRPIVSFEADEAAPVTVAFLIDVSGSMSVSNKIGLAHTVSDTMLNAMREGEDEAALFAFDTQVYALQGFTRDLDRIGRALPRMNPFGTTSLYDAIGKAAAAISATPSRHAALVVITDGFDTSSTMTAGEVSGIASASDVPIYVVATVAPADRAAVDQQLVAEGYGANLRDLAQWSGGNVLVASSDADAERIGAALLAELRHQYVIGIDAAPSEGWRRVEVRVNVKGAIARARSGYFGLARRS
jgi:VWFA-related protein